MQKNGQFVDDPEAREKIWKTAPRAVDKFGNKLIKIGHYWCAFDFNRFWQLAVDESEEEPFYKMAIYMPGYYSYVEEY